MIPVFCCCDPNNEIGEAPASLPYETRLWEDEDGVLGVAYISEGVNWDDVPGFRRKPKKTWKGK